LPPLLPVFSTSFVDNLIPPKSFIEENSLRFEHTFRVALLPMAPFSLICARFDEVKKLPLGTISPLFQRPHDFEFLATLTPFCAHVPPLTSDPPAYFPLQYDFFPSLIYVRQRIALALLPERSFCIQNHLFYRTFPKFPELKMSRICS